MKSFQGTISSYYSQFSDIFLNFTQLCRPLCPTSLFSWFQISGQYRCSEEELGLSDQQVSKNTSSGIQLMTQVCTGCSLSKLLTLQKSFPTINYLYREKALNWSFNRQVLSIMKAITFSLISSGRNAYPETWMKKCQPNPLTCTPYMKTAL